MSCAQRVDQNASLEEVFLKVTDEEPRAGLGSVNRTGAAPLLASTALLVRLRLRRLANQLTAGTQPKKKAGGKARTGNPGKKTSKVILYLGGAGDAVRVRLDRGRGRSPICIARSIRRHLLGARWSSARRSRVGVAFLLLFLWMSSLLLTIASGELAKPDWDLEWLITLPIRSDTLVVGANPRTQRRQSFGRGRAGARVHADRVVFRLSLDRAHRGLAGRLAVAAARGAGAHAARHRPAPHAAARATAQPARRHLRAVHRRDVSGDLDGPPGQGGLHVRRRRHDAGLAGVHPDGPHRARDQRTQLRRRRAAVC